MCAALCALAVAACGDGDQHPAVTTPAAPEGGGVSGGALSDTLTVYAISADSGRPVPGADVFLGAGQGAHRVGQTGSDGKLLVSGLDGSPQMVSIKAAGYAGATWGFVKSAVATVPLEPMTSSIGEATISVSVPGWKDLPALDSGFYRVARFAFSRPRSLEALEAALDNPIPGCIQAETATDCEVTLSVPSDSTALLVVIAEGSDAGTPHVYKDDTLAVTALGIQTDLALHDGTTLPLALPLLDSAAVARATLVTTAPSADIFKDVIGVPGISLDGQILLYPSLGPLATSFLVPTASGPFVNGKLWAVATAGDGTDARWLRVYERGIDPPRSSSQAIDLATSTFSDSPSVERTGPSAYMLSGDGNLERLELATASGERLDVLLFPTQTEFEIPAGMLDEEPTSASVESFDLEVDLSEFDFTDLARQSTRIAYSRVDTL